ncbi:MAG: ammonia channel protein, partial [Pseudomonadota bacterium]|nr:ammonia channel protein [Pseudomonadota bacterium]
MRLAQATTSAPAAAPIPSAVTAPAGTPAAAAPAAVAAATGASATPPTPTPNKGDNAWMIVATLLVIMMSIPGLALFYGGLVRSKNMLSVLMQVFVVFSLIVVLWTVYGYSIAFTEGNAFFGGTDRVLLKGIFSLKDGVGAFATAATFTKGVVIPEYLYVAFQATFAAITVGLVVGAFAERVKFSAVLLFAVLWFTFAYLPIAHMVWFWPGPDAFTDAKAAELATAKGGWLWTKGVLDFAGGTVVH